MNIRIKIDDVMKDFEDGREIYFVGNQGLFKFKFNTEKIGQMFYIHRYTEFLQLYRVVNLFETLKIYGDLDESKKAFGKKFQIEFTIENTNPEPVQITSIELELPDNIEFIDVDPEGYIGQGPGMSRGIYMWVSDDYIVEPDSKINLIVYLRGRAPGKSMIDLRITTHEVYIEADGIEIEIE